ncbi:MAG TPA: outer membrane beta-barrel protein [Candidatus Saccharimonadia bacterium]|nr:outer membrane beta-barrel protein [Candidatus Saccharimonadia bacterium]
MKKTALSLALAASALVAATAAQAQDTGFFIEGRVGSASIDEDQFDDDTTAVAFNAGYRWGGWGIEAGYVTFDDFDGEVDDIEIQAGVDGFTIGLNGRTNLADGPWYLSSRLGAFLWDAEADDVIRINNTPTRIDADTDGTDLYAGIGVGYDFSDQFSLGVAYDYFGVEDDDVTLDTNVISVTGEIRF